jgi:hypothetical protein
MQSSCNTEKLPGSNNRIEVRSSPKAVTNYQYTIFRLFARLRLGYRAKATHLLIRNLYKCGLLLYRICLKIQGLATDRVVMSATAPASIRQAIPSYKNSQIGPL